MQYCVFGIKNLFSIQLLKTYEKNVYKCIGILHENDQQQT